MFGFIDPDMVQITETQASFKFINALTGEAVRRIDPSLRSRQPVSPFATSSGWPMRASTPRWWSVGDSYDWRRPKVSSDCSRPRPSTSSDRRNPPAKSDGRPCNGSTGITLTGYTAHSVTSPPKKQRSQPARTTIIRPVIP